MHCEHLAMHGYPSRVLTQQQALMMAVHVPAFVQLTSNLHMLTALSLNSYITALLQS